MIPQKPDPSLTATTTTTTTTTTSLIDPLPITMSLSNLLQKFPCLLEAVIKMRYMNHYASLDHNTSKTVLFLDPKICCAFLHLSSSASVLNIRQVRSSTTGQSSSSLSSSLSAAARLPLLSPAAPVSPVFGNISKSSRKTSGSATFCGISSILTRL